MKNVIEAYVFLIGLSAILIAILAIVMPIFQQAASLLNR